MSKNQMDKTVVQKVQIFNKRVPISLEREQNGFPKKFRKERYRNDPQKALSEIYDYLDRYYAFSKGLVACSKGCSYCCHIPVSLYQLEADYIEQHTGIKAVKDVKGSSVFSGEWVDQTKPCPFLQATQCSIYPYRPLSCRTHVSFESSNEKCRFGSKSTIQMINRDSSFPGVMQAFRELSANYNPIPADIRDYFGVSNIPGIVLLRH